MRKCTILSRFLLCSSKCPTKIKQRNKYKNYNEHLYRYKLHWQSWFCNVLGQSFKQCPALLLQNNNFPRRKAVLQVHAYFHKLQSTCLQLSVTLLKIQYVVSEEKGLTLIVTFKRKDFKITIIQISTVKTNLNNKISAGINSVRNTEYLH